MRQTRQKFGIIILDPPYRHGHIAEVLPIAARKLEEGGCIICEYESEAEIPQTPEGLMLRKTYRYGKINVTIFERPASGEHDGEAETE